MTIIEEGKESDPYYFLYRLDITDQQCAVKRATDLFEINKLFNLRKDDSLGLIMTDDVDKSKGTKSERYQQYYKGIAVNGCDVLFNFNDNKVSSIAGRFIPNLDIDTTGMISREAAAKTVIDNADYYPQFKDRIDPNYFAQTTKPIIDGNGKKIVYKFYVNKLSKKPGQYYINATSGKIWRFQPDIANYVTDCYKCNGNIASMLSCQDTCTANIPTSFSDNRAVEVPTIYNNCQTIYADSTTNANKIIYRMSPVSIGLNDFINVYDASNYYSAPTPPTPYEIRYCYQDSVLSKKNTIATLLYYAASVAKNYFQYRNIDHNLPISIYSHVPDDPFGSPSNSAAWVQSEQRFEIGDGDGITMNAPVSIDIVGHEYGHRVLYNTFSIGTHVTNDTAVNKYKASAIHEAVADIFSVLVRRHTYGTTDWTLGNGAVISSQSNLPRNLEHPENTTPPQSLYYNDTASHWDTTEFRIYNHAGIIAKWFYLLSQGGTGSHFVTDAITVQGISIDTAELVLLKGLDTLKKTNTAVPSYDQFCHAMVAAAQTISCTAHKQTIVAFKAVGLGLNIPGGKLNQAEEEQEDEEGCFIDLQMRDCWGDTQGYEPNHECDLPGWQDIWVSPDLWNCPDGECDLADADNPQSALQNHIGFRIYNANPNLISDAAQLHLYYTMGSTGEYWDTNPLYNSWIDNYYSTGTETCYLGDEIPNSPITIPAIDPQQHYTDYTTWSPPNFVNPDYPFYADPNNCGLQLEKDPNDGEYRYEICLLARLESVADPIKNEQSDAVTNNILNSNNIVTRNMFLLDPAQGFTPNLPPVIPAHPSVILMANNNDEIKHLNLLLDKVSGGSTAALNEVLKIELILGQPLWDKWASTGFKGEGIQITAEREVKITDMATAKLLDIPFDPREFQPFAIRATILSYSGKTTNMPNDYTFRVTHEAYNSTDYIKPASNCLFRVTDLDKKSQDVTIATQLSCYPNPFDESVQISFYLPSPQKVSLAVYNTQGKLIQSFANNTFLQAGLHSYQLSSNVLPSGVYMCQLTADKQITVQKIVHR